MVRGMYMRMGFGPLPEPTAGNTSGEVAARINHGRWLVDCSGCNSALVVDLSELVFMCVECGNAGNEGKWFNVIVPRNRKAIETELLKRPWNGRNPAEAISHQISADRLHKVTYLLSDAVQFSDFWILNTSALGTNTRLAY